MFFDRHHYIIVNGNVLPVTTLPEIHAARLALLDAGLPDAEILPMPGPGPRHFEQQVYGPRRLPALARSHSSLPMIASVVSATTREPNIIEAASCRWHLPSSDFQVTVWSLTPPLGYRLVHAFRVRESDPVCGLHLRSGVRVPPDLVPWLKWITPAQTARRAARDADPADRVRLWHTYANLLRSLGLPEWAAVVSARAHYLTLAHPPSES